MNRNLNVLHIISTLKRCGPVNVLFNQLKNSQDLPVTYRILTLSSEGNASRQRDFEEIGVRVDTLGLSRWTGAILGPLLIKKFVKQNGIDVVHCHGFRPDVFVSSVPIRVLKVSSIQCVWRIDYSKAFGRVKGRLMEIAEIISTFLMDYSIVCSESVRQTLPSFLRTKVVHNGVEVVSIEGRQAPMKIAARFELGLEEQDIVFLFVGDLSIRKDPATAINGFLQANLPSAARLLIVGDGSERSNCERLVKDNARVKFIGFQSDLAKVYLAADYYLASSLGEGLPTSVLEAASYGIPLILSDIDPHLEILACSPNAGIRFKVGSTADLAKKLDSIILENRSEKSLASRMLILNEFNSKKMSLQIFYSYVEERASQFKKRSSKVDISVTSELVRNTEDKNVS